MSSYFWSGIHCVLNILLLIIKLEIRFLSFSEDRKKKVEYPNLFQDPVVLTQIQLWQRCCLCTAKGCRLLSLLLPD